MPIDPSIALGGRPLEVPNPMNQLAQVTQIQAAQQQQQASQMKLEDMIAERKELNQFAAKIKEKGFEPRAYMEMLVTSRNPEMQKMGIEGMMRLNRQDKFEKTYSKILPQLFGMAPEGATAPAAAPAAPMQPGALGSGTFGVAPEPTQTNALAPTAAPTTPAAPVNQLAAPQAAGMSIPQMEMLALELANEDDPRAKTAVSLIEKKIEAARKPSLHVVPGVGLVDVTGKTVRASEVAPSEFERLLSGAGLTDAQKTELRRQRALKEATHAPATTVNVSTEKKYGEAFGGKLADVDINKMTTAEKAPQLAESANRIVGLVQQGNLFTGPAADIKLNIARALNVAGANNQEKIANTESLIAATGQSTLDAIKGAGLGTGQGFTDKDLKFLQGIAGGTINLTQQTLTELATLQHRAATRSAEAWNKRVKEMPKEVVQGTGLSTTPITVPALVAPAAKKQPSVVAVPAPAGIDAALWNVMTPQERALWQK